MTQHPMRRLRNRTRWLWASLLVLPADAYEAPSPTNALSVLEANLVRLKEESARLNSVAEVSPAKQQTPARGQVRAPAAPERTNLATVRSLEAALTAENQHLQRLRGEQLQVSRTAAPTRAGEGVSLLSKERSQAVDTSLLLKLAVVFGLVNSVVFLTWRVSDTEPRLLHKAKQRVAEPLLRAVGKGTYEVELSELQVTQMPSVPAEAVLTLELGGRVLAESRAHCQQGHARFQERMALQIQGGGSEGQSCMLRVSAKGTRSSPPNCPEEFSAEVAFTTKDIMRRVHSKHGQQYFHYRMLPKDSSASASLRPSLSMRLREVTGR